MKWIKRNWKWFFPVVVVAVFTVGISFMLLLKRSDLYKIALESTQHNRGLIEQIGEPIEPGFLVAGTVKWAGPDGSGNMSFSVNGPKGSGVVYCVAEKHEGTWTFHEFNVTLQNGKKISLLAP